MTWLEVTTRSIQELGAAAFACRILILGLLFGAVFDEPIDRWVIACAIFFLILGEVSLRLHQHFRGKYGR